MTFMIFHMFRLVFEKAEVFYSIVILYSIGMMDNFFRHQVSFYVSFHNKPRTTDIPVFIFMWMRRARNKYPSILLRNPTFPVCSNFPFAAFSKAAFRTTFRYIFFKWINKIFFFTIKTNFFYLFLFPTIRSTACRAKHAPSFSDSIREYEKYFSALFAIFSDFAHKSLLKLKRAFFSMACKKCLNLYMLTQSPKIIGIKKALPASIDMLQFNTFSVNRGILWLVK